MIVRCMANLHRNQQLEEHLPKILEEHLHTSRLCTGCKQAGVSRQAETKLYRHLPWVEAAPRRARWKLVEDHYYCRWNLGMLLWCRNEVPKHSVGWKGPAVTNDGWGAKICKQGNDNSIFRPQGNGLHPSSSCRPQSTTEMFRRHYWETTSHTATIPYLLYSVIWPSATTFCSPRQKKKGRHFGMEHNACS